jgi:NADP-reducing hydrogenase subunit HndB
VPKIKPEDLDKIRESMAKAMSLREGEVRAKITVHMGTCGIAAGARKVMSALMAALDQREDKDIVLTTSGCAGLCSREPMITVELKGEPPVKYVDLDEAKARKIFEEHVLAGTVVKEYALAVGSERVG